MTVSEMQYHASDYSDNELRNDAPYLKGDLRINLVLAQLGITAEDNANKHPFYDIGSLSNTVEASPIDAENGDRLITQREQLEAYRKLVKNLLATGSLQDYNRMCVYRHDNPGISLSDEELKQMLATYLEKRLSTYDLIDSIDYERLLKKFKERSINASKDERYEDGDILKIILIDNLMLSQRPLSERIYCLPDYVYSTLADHMIESEEHLLQLPYEDVHKIVKDLVAKRDFESLKMLMGFDFRGKEAEEEFIGNVGNSYVKRGKYKSLRRLTETIGIGPSSDIVETTYGTHMKNGRIKKMEKLQEATGAHLPEDVARALVQYVARKQRNHKTIRKGLSKLATAGKGAPSYLVKLFC